LKSFTFTDSVSDELYSFDYEQSLFNVEEHRMLQAQHGWVSYYVIDESLRKIMASIHFLIEDDVAKSPLRAPFGSIEFSMALPLKVLYEFIGYFERQLLQKEIRKILIKGAPEGYYENTGTLTAFLINHGFVITNSDIASVIDVTGPSLKEKLHRSEQKRLRKAENENLTFSNLPMSRLEEVYEFILRCRTEKKYELSMSLELLTKSVKTFKDRYYLFGIFDGDIMAAASIAILVKRDLLYEFYHDHLQQFDHVSPVVKLVEGINEFCFNNGITKLDLGTSSLGTTPNFGLLNFKLLLGAKPVPKFTFEKNLTA
jgi:hypothetical protein